MAVYLFGAITTNNAWHLDFAPLSALHLHLASNEQLIMSVYIAKSYRQ